MKIIKVIFICLLVFATLENKLEFVDEIEKETTTNGSCNHCIKIKNTHERNKCFAACPDLTEIGTGGKKNPPKVVPL